MTRGLLITVLLMTAVALSFSNFLYQAFVDKDWAVAIERSFFQAFALLIAGFGVWAFWE